MVKSKQIFLCSGEFNNSNGWNSGGKRRLNELFQAIQKSNHQVTLISTFFKALLALGKIFRNIDSVVVAFDERYLPRAILLKFFGAKLVFCPRGNKIEHYKFTYGKVKLDLYKLIFSFLYKFCDKMIFQTFTQKEEFSKVFGCNTNFSVVPNNINSSWMRNLGDSMEFPQSPQYYKVGFLGGDNPRKGGDILLVAFESLQDINVNLLVGGEYKNPPAIDNISFVGHITDLEDFYSSIDLVIVPSLYDSFPNVMLEGLNAHKPVLVGRTPIMEEICKGAEDILFNLNTSELACKIEGLYQDRKAWKEVLGASQKLRNKYNFDWEKMFINKIIDVI